MQLLLKPISYFSGAITAIKSYQSICRAATSQRNYRRCIIVISHNDFLPNRGRVQSKQPSILLVSRERQACGMPPAGICVRMYIGTASANSNIYIYVRFTIRAIVGTFIRRNGRDRADRELRHRSELSAGGATSIPDASENC